MVILFEPITYYVTLCEGKVNIDKKFIARVSMAA